MKPGDHPEFFRMAPPPGTSRESTIILDREGRFWHDGGLVEPRALADALHRWIAIHPDDGRFILTNGYDWTYFTVETTPFFVRSVVDVGFPELRLSDGSTERLDPRTVRFDHDGAVVVRVKNDRFDARFTPSAQRELESWVASDEPLRLVIGNDTFPLGDQHPA